MVTILKNLSAPLIRVQKEVCIRNWSWTIKKVTDRNATHEWVIWAELPFHILRLTNELQMSSILATRKACFAWAMGNLHLSSGWMNASHLSNHCNYWLVPDGGKEWLMPYDSAACLAFSSSSHPLCAEHSARKRRGWEEGANVVVLLTHLICMMVRRRKKERNNMRIAEVSVMLLGGGGATAQGKKSAICYCMVTPVGCSQLVRSVACRIFCPNQNPSCLAPSELAFLL